jgi:hypothetical protein
MASDEAKRHRHVGEELATRVRLVGADAADEDDAGGIEFHGSSASIIGFRAQRLDPEIFIFNSCRTPQVSGV